MLKELKPGVYRHYKGAFYLVHELARFHDSGELMVLYTPLTPHEGEKMRKTVCFYFQLGNQTRCSYCREESESP